MNKLIDYIKINNLGEFYTNKSFKDVTTLKIGGKIKLLFYPSTIDNFIMFHKFYLKNKHYDLIVIGNGSNILANSKEYEGIVVSFKKVKNKYKINDNIIEVCSGVMITDLIYYCMSNNYGGFEKLAYIPATIGGMVKMNASAYDSCISDNLKSVKVLNEHGIIHKYYKKDIIFDYRKSSIKDIILECEFELYKKEKEEIIKNINYVKENRRNKQPLNSYNAGSTFKNINNIRVWNLIDKLGLRGYSINDAQVSNKHCNFIINKKNCESEDMIKLIKFIQEQVEKEYKIKLEIEWNFINF